MTLLNEQFDIIRLMHCGNCRETEKNHVDGNCLFSPTRFRPMTPEELDALYPRNVSRSIEGYWTMDGRAIYVAGPVITTPTERPFEATPDDDAKTS